jgi:hypothetical protein
MTTAPACRLTWHRGSVLPYASLWHTVQRAMWLNALRPSELSFRARAHDQGGFPRQVNLLFNETSGGSRGAIEALSMQSLAQALGEPETAFTWAHLGRVPRSVRSLITPSVRVCRACLAAGYHSALHSLWLMQTCPIHGCELEDRCNCRERFNEELVNLNRMNPGYCRCGRMAFVTRQTCRRPTMRPEETAPMSVVASWLERLEGVVRPLPNDRQAQRAHDLAFMESFEAWCAELGLGMPGPRQGPGTTPLCTSISMAPLSAIERGCAARPAVDTVQHVQTGRRKHGSYWFTNDATTIYRALARHIRRHVARGAEAVAIDFMLNPDPLQMGARMRAQPRAMVAFADLLFTECMESYAGLRRWPYRDPRAGANSWVQDGLLPLRIDGGRAWPPTSRDARLAWVDRQAASAAITHAWRRAQSIAIQAAATGIADWSAANERYVPAGDPCSSFVHWPKPSRTAFWFDAPPPYQVTWAAAISGEYLRFVASPATPRIDWTMPRSSKAQRQTTWSTALQTRVSELHGACTGPCLTWSARAGWEVRPSASPIAPAKRHRLLGVGGALKFWVFPSGGGFAARACEARIQAFGGTAREAIDTLRLAVRQHSRRYPPPRPSPPSPMGTPVPLRPEIHGDYEMLVARELCDHGFWQRAWMFGRLAREHLADGQRQSGR